MAKIRELNWHKAAFAYLVAETPIGTYGIFRTPSGHFIPCFDEAVVLSADPASNLDAAKSEAWSYHVAIVSQLIEGEMS